MWTVLTLFFVLDNFVFTFIEAAYGKQILALDQTFTQMTSLPDTHQVRWLPYEVAKRYGDTSMQDPTLQLGEFHAFDKNIYICKYIYRACSKNNKFALRWIIA